MKFTRREAIKATAALVSGLGLSKPLLAQAPLNRVTIPSSGQLIPRIGMGCRNYRAEANSPDLAVFRDTFAAYHRLGGKLVDTSPNYGNSETVIGNIMRELKIRDALWVASKVDREDREDGIARMEHSFKLLGGEYFELMQVHNLIGTDTQLETMKSWKEQGRFRHIGVTTSSDRQYDQLAALMEKHTLDFVQIDYSMGNRSAAERILPMAQDKGIAVLTNLPFGRGRLFNAVGERPLPDWATDIDAPPGLRYF
jgi:aryl-alcohol dehydrogenase-like predicted oxidoreductase